MLTLVVRAVLGAAFVAAGINFGFLQFKLVSELIENEAMYSGGIVTLAFCLFCKLKPEPKFSVEQ
jgi:hypothetical protein